LSEKKKDEVKKCERGGLKGKNQERGGRRGKTCAKAGKKRVKKTKEMVNRQ